MRLTSVLFLLASAVVLQNGAVDARDGKCHPYFRIAKPAGPGKAISKTKAGSRRASSKAAASAAWHVADLCKAYSLPQNLSGTGVIGILELGGGWVQSDLDQFSALNNLPKIQVTNVSVDGTSNSPSSPPDLSSADVEVALDIEVAAATYYYATGKMPVIKVFFADNTYESMEAVINAAVAENCDVLSISWGADEASWEDSAPGAAAKLEAAAKAATARGMVILAASGDSSSSDGVDGTNVDVPAACPHIVGCGGTTKTTSSEVVWGSGVATEVGTGGGFSKLFSTQSFQINAPRGSGRLVPDIAANADPQTGYLMVYGGAELQVGGTSAVSPLYAGLFAATGRSLGFVTPVLWKHPYAFADVTQGSNGAYSAAVGPDACTGLGVPRGGGITGLFSDVGQAFTIKVMDRIAGNYQAILAFNDSALGEFSVDSPESTGTGTYHQIPPTAVVSTVLGKSSASSPLLPGNFTAVIIDWKASGIPFLFDQTSAQIYGAGVGVNSSKKLEFYSFSGKN